jgi:hypothetical protein
VTFIPPVAVAVAEVAAAPPVPAAPLAGLPPAAAPESSDVPHASGISNADAAANAPLRRRDFALVLRRIAIKRAARRLTRNAQSRHDRSGKDYFPALFAPQRAIPASRFRGDR